jgi:hypothetical protein
MALTQDDLITELQQLAEELRTTPTIEEMNEQGAYSGVTYYNHFDSWNAALEQAGLETTVESHISRDDLLEDLQYIDEMIEGSHPTVTAIKEHGTYSLTTYYNAFGGLEEALQEADIEMVEEAPISKEEIISEIQRLATDNTPPTTDQMDEQGAFTARTCSDRFGSWNAAVTAAGYEPHLDPSAATRDDLLDEIRRLGEERGRTPAVREMRDHGKYPPSRYFRNFDSWNDAVVEAGYPPNERRGDPAKLQIPESELIDELQRLADDIGGRPTTEDMLTDGKYSTKPYYNRFESWNQAVEIAGYTPFTGTSEDVYSSEELLTELTRLADALGHPPTTTEMAEQGAISTPPYQKRFGSWIEALREAGLEPSERQRRKQSHTSG